MEKPVIKEIIVVEGRDDTRRLKEAVICETIETNGSAINERTLEEIEVALNTRGAIIFTDPDFPGHKIRNTIIERFPNIKEAFLPKHKALGHNSVGVEHARLQDIRSALENCQTSQQVEEEQITIQDMQYLRLSGNAAAKERREYLTEKLNIGYANATQLRKKLNRYSISPEKVAEILNELEVNK
ncbi:ribonuclease M5 [Jeotgalicoccus coquinae]|uniref:Ribonuclease M5 n=1 Tax=Jeotgalicoccus coquinae TaxID=709509 RepID=A0A6V7RQQ0_9STAP|nr:ribonuclease M5 [Jeotgalicoccus coquinae]MBB6423811.1 ribonuclease M5 [Jeotgalicoccus coquinae]GGE24797.1 ribonuclease M5 [Jeotgalicoccus coquinae]CAD2080867.1 Ribonuclease M5 [Jeotgalicoccus coquinae]